MDARVEALLRDLRALQLDTCQLLDRARHLLALVENRQPKPHA